LRSSGGKDQKIAGGEDLTVFGRTPWSGSCLEGRQIPGYGRSSMLIPSSGSLFWVKKLGKVVFVPTPLSWAIGPLMGWMLPAPRKGGVNKRRASTGTLNSSLGSVFGSHRALKYRNRQKRTQKKKRKTKPRPKPHPKTQRKKKQNPKAPQKTKNHKNNTKPPTGRKPKKNHRKKTNTRAKKKKKKENHTTTEDTNAVPRLSRRGFIGLARRGARER